MAVIPPNKSKKPQIIKLFLNSLTTSKQTSRIFIGMQKYPTTHKVKITASDIQSKITRQYKETRKFDLSRGEYEPFGINPEQTQVL